MALIICIYCGFEATDPFTMRRHLKEKHGVSR